MRFPVDILADVSHEELERSSLIYMNKLLYSNPDFPEHLRLTATTQVPIQSSNVGLVPLYRYSSQHKLLALFPPTDLSTAVAFYLLDQWWTLEDIVKTADPARDGVVQVETVGERIVLYVLNRWIYKETEMNTDELPFLCHTENDYAKILWKDGAAVGFYSVKPSGVSFDSSSTRTYQLPVMDSLFVRKCHRGHGIGLHLLEDFVHSFKEDYLGLKYPLSVTMYKVCEKYLSKYPEYADVLWEVERTGTPTQRTNIANKIRTMDLRAVTKNLSFTEEPLVATEGTTEDVVTETMTTRIDEPDSVECSGQSMEDPTVLEAVRDADKVPVVGGSRSSGSDRAKMKETVTEDSKSEKVIRIEDIEAETPQTNQFVEEHKMQVHNVSELGQTWQAEAVLSMDTEEKGEWVFDQSLDDATATDLQSSDHDSLLTSNLEETAVTTAGAGEDDAPPVDLDNSQNLHRTSFDTQITVEIVASEIEGVEEESQKEKTAVHLVLADSLDTDEGVEVLDQTDEGTKGIAFENDSIESDKNCDIRHISQVVAGGITAGKTAVKVKKRAQSKTPRRRSQRHNKSPSVSRETSRQGCMLVLRGRTVVRTPTPKRQHIRKDQKIRKDLDKELDEFVASPIRKKREHEVALENEANKQSGAAVQKFVEEKLMEEKQHRDAEQLTKEEKMETCEEPERQDALLAELSDTEPEEDNKRTEGDELEKVEKQAQEHSQEGQEVEKMERELSVDEMTAGVKEFIKNVTVLTEGNEEEKTAEGVAEITNVLEVKGDDAREESETGQAVSTRVPPDEVQEEANSIIEPAAAAQETDIISQIHKLQKKAVVVLVDLKTTCHHLQLKASEETSAAREQLEKEQLDVTAALKAQAAFGSSAVDDQSSGSDNIEETSWTEMSEALTVEEKELGEEELANVDDAKSDAAIPVVIETKALRSGRKTVRPGCKSLSRPMNLKEDKGTGTAGEDDEAKTAAMPMEGHIVKDVVTEQDSAENLQTAGSKTFADTETTIPVPEDMNENLFSGEVTRMDEDEAPVVEARQLRSGTKIITSTPTPKSTRRKERDQDQDKETVENNAEEELQGKLSTLTQVGISTSVIPEDKLTKPTEEENQMEEEESLTAEESGPLSQSVSIEIMVGKAPVLAEEAILEGSTITEQSPGVSETFRELKASAEGTSLEEELPPVVETRARRGGRQMMRGPTKYRSGKGTTQQEHVESEGGVSPEKNIDDEETRAEIIGAKSDVGRSKELQKECEEKQESTSVEGEVQEEETRLTTTKQKEDKREETPEEEDKIKGGTEAKSGEEPELGTVEMEAVMSDDTKETKTNRAGLERDTEEATEVEQMGTILVKHISDTAGVTSSQCQESQEQESEGTDRQVCNLQTVTVALDDRGKDDHEVQEESAAVECQVVLERTAAEEEEQRDLIEEETKSKEQVPETPARETEVDVSAVEEKRFDKVTDDVTMQESVEGKQSVALCDEVMTPVKGTEMIWTISGDEEEEPEVHIRVLRSGKKSITERPSTKRAQVQVQGEKNNEKEEPVTPEDKEAEMKQGRENVEDEKAHLQERREAEVEVEVISFVETQKDAGEVGQCDVCVEKEEAGHAVGGSAEEDLPTKVTGQNKQEVQHKEQGGESGENKEEAREKTSTLTPRGKSTSVTPEGKSTKPTEEEDQMEEEESLTAEESGPLSQSVSIEIMVEKAPALAEEAILGGSTITEQSPGVSETFGELKASVEGTSLEEELPPVVETRARRGGRKTMRGPTKYRSREGTKQQEHIESEGGVSPEKNTDDEETRTEIIGAKSDVGRGDEVQKECEEKQESTFEEAEVQEEETRMTTTKQKEDKREETPEEEDKIKGGTEAKSGEEPELGTVEMEAVMSDDTKETKTNRAGLERDTDEAMEVEQMGTILVKHISDTAGVTSSQCQESQEQESEGTDRQVCNLQTVTVALDNRGKDDHEVQEESAAVECQVVLEKTAAEEEEQRDLIEEETKSKEQVPETPARETEVDVSAVEEKRFDKKVTDDVLMQESVEGKQSVALCDEVMTPVKGTEMIWTISGDEEEEPEVHIRVLRSGKKSITERRSTKRAQVQVQGEKNNEKEEPVTPEDKEAEMKQGRENVEDEKAHLQERREAEVEVEVISIVETQKDAGEVGQCDVCVEKEEAGHAVGGSAEEDLPTKVSDQNKQEVQDEQQGGESGENKEEAREKTSTSTPRGKSTSVTPEGKSTKPTEEEDQMEEEESITPENEGEEVRENIMEQSGDITVEIMVEKAPALAEEAEEPRSGENTVIEQSAGVSEEFRELKTSAEGSSFEEEELPPVVETRAQRGGRKRIRSPTKYRSRRGTKVSDQNTQETLDKEQSGESAENKEAEAHGETSTSTQGGTPTCGREDKSTKPTEERDQIEEEESITVVETVIDEEDRSQEVTLESKDKEIIENIRQESGPKTVAVTIEVIVEKVTAVAEKTVSGEAELEKKQDAIEFGHCGISIESKEADHAVSGNAEDHMLSKKAEEAGEDSTSTSNTICEIAQTSARESVAEDVPQKEALVTETRVLRSGGKTRQRQKASINQQQKDKEDAETSGEKSAEEEEEITERRILRKGRKSTPATSRQKSKRGRIQRQEEEEDESSPAEKTVGKEDVLELEKDQTEQKVEEAASGENEGDTEPGTETIESVGEESDTREQKQFVLSEELPEGQEATPDGKKATDLLLITQTDEDRVDKIEKKDKSATETEGKKELDKSKDHKETVMEELVTEENQSTVSEACVVEQGQAFPGKSAKDDSVEPLPEELETNFSEIRVLRSGRKAVKPGQASTNQQQKDKQDPETAEDKLAEEDEVIAETRILRKGRKTAPTPSIRKSKRARIQRQEEEEETGEEEQTAALDSTEEKDTEEETSSMLKEEGKALEMELGKTAEEEGLTEHVESMTREEEDNSAVVPTEKAGMTEDALSEEVTPTESEEMKTSEAAVEETVPEMIEEPSDEVERTSKSVEGCPVIGKATTATGTLHRERNTVIIEETQAEDASTVTVEQAQAATSGRHRRQKDHIEAEQQQEEGKPEQEDTIHLAEFPGIVHKAEESSSTGKEAEPLAKDPVEENFDEPADVVTITETADKNIESPEEAVPERKEGTTPRSRRKTLPVASGTKSKDYNIEVEDTEEPEHPKRRSVRRSHRHRSYKEGGRLGGETDAANEEDDDKIELQKIGSKDEDEEDKCSADAQTQMMEENVQDYSQTSETGGEDADVLTSELDSDQETEKTGIKGEDDQSMSEEENEPVVIRERVLRGRTVPSLVVTPQSKRRSSKGKRAEDASSNDDWEQSSHLAQTVRLRKRKSTEATPARQSKRHSRV